MTDYGVVTRNEEEVGFDAFDLGFYEVKDVTGRAAEPIAHGVNMVSCFGDTAAVDAQPELAAVDGEGRRATREQPYFDWAYVCPSHADYRRGVLEVIGDAAAANDAVRLDDVGFPRPEYCQCARCDERFAAWQSGDGPDPDGSDAPESVGSSGGEDSVSRRLASGAAAFDGTETLSRERAAWRAAEMTAFVAEAVERIPGRTYLTLYPDPYPGHLYERSGLSLPALAELVDEFVVPLYDTAYGTTYWLESLVKGFQSRLDPLPVEFSVELYAVQVGIDELIHATEVAREYADGVFFGYEASNASAALRRMRADAREGVEHGASVDAEDADDDGSGEE